LLDERLETEASKYLEKQASNYVQILITAAQFELLVANLIVAMQYRTTIGCTGSEELFSSRLNFWMRQWLLID
jgi:hypothetical protein